MKKTPKKILLVLALLFCVPFFTHADLASTNEDISDYIFSFEFTQNTPRVSTETIEPYTIIPVIEHAVTLTSGEYRGDIISGKGKLLSRFWFDTPTTIVAAIGKQRADIHAPYFANADRVSIYKGSNTTPLFTISLKGSSFCNENTICNKEVGENYQNCASDCPIPTTGTAPSLTLPPEETRGKIIPTITEVVIEPIVLAGTNEGTTTRTAGDTENNNSSVIQLTLGIFLILIAIVGYVAWKRAMNSRGIE